MPLSLILGLLYVLSSVDTRDGLTVSKLLAYRKDLLNFIPILVEKIKNERAYTMSGSLLRAIFEGLTSTYTLHRQSLNTDHWKASGTGVQCNPSSNTNPTVANDRRLYHQWGKFYDAKEVKIDWHCTTEEEISFVLELLENITGSSLFVLEKLLDILPANRDKIWRNDWVGELLLINTPFRLITPECSVGTSISLQVPGKVSTN
jgi:proteasome activator subunit 4